MRLRRKKYVGQHRKHPVAQVESLLSFMEEIERNAPHFLVYPDGTRVPVDRP